MAATPTSPARCTRSRSRIAGKSDVAVDVTLAGTLGHRQLRVRTPRAFEDANHVAARRIRARCSSTGSSLPGLAALAIVADGDGRRRTSRWRHYSLRRSIQRGRAAVASRWRSISPSARNATARRPRPACCAGADGASCCRPPATRCSSLEQSTGHEAIDRLINRNLLFAYFYGVGRALDDAQYYLVRTRAPWNGHGVTVRDWEALMWTVPAVQLADPPLARELLLRMCELHGYAPGRGVHYLDGTLFEPGFALEGVASYALATDRYIRDTGDDRVVDEPALADTLYLSAEDLDARKDKRVPLFSTEVSPSGTPAVASVHAARQRRRCPGARGAPPHARRRDVARSAGSRRRARRDQPALRDRGERTVDVRIGGRSRRLDVDARRSGGVGVLAAALRRRVAAGLDLSAHGEGDRRRRRTRSRSSARG